MKTIGFVGLGHMGSPMVKNLLHHRYQVKVFDINEAAMHELVSAGAVATKSPAEIAQDSDVVITMLQTGDQVKKSCLGEQGIFAHLNKPDSLFIDSSSIDIKTSRQLHEEAASRGIAMLDAPVSGGTIGAENAMLTFMVGGHAHHVKRAESLFNAMGKKIIHAGPAGCGAAAKICNNMILGVSMIAVCEAFVLADKIGLDPKKLFEISSNASGQCWALNLCCPWPNILPNVPSSHDYQPGFSAKMMLKDLKLSQDAAQQVHATTPLGKQATDLYQQFVNSNTTEIDFSGIIKMLAGL